MHNMPSSVLESVLPQINSLQVSISEALASLNATVQAEKLRRQKSEERWREEAKAFQQRVEESLQENRDDIDARQRRMEREAHHMRRHVVHKLKHFSQLLFRAPCRSCKSHTDLATSTSAFSLNSSHSHRFQQNAAEAALSASFPLILPSNSLSAPAMTEATAGLESLTEPFDHQMEENKKETGAAVRDFKIDHEKHQAKLLLSAPISSFKTTERLEESIQLLGSDMNNKLTEIISTFDALKSVAEVQQKQMQRMLSALALFENQLRARDIRDIEATRASIVTNELLAALGIKLDTKIVAAITSVPSTLTIVSTPRNESMNCFSPSSSIFSAMRLPSEGKLLQSTSTSGSSSLASIPIASASASTYTNTNTGSNSSARSSATTSVQEVGLSCPSNYCMQRQLATAHGFIPFNLFARFHNMPVGPSRRNNPIAALFISNSGAADATFSYASQTEWLTDTIDPVFKQPLQYNCDSALLGQAWIKISLYDACDETVREEDRVGSVVLSAHELQTAHQRILEKTTTISPLLFSLSHENPARQTLLKNTSMTLELEVETTVNEDDLESIDEIRGRAFSECGELRLDMLIACSKLPFVSGRKQNHLVVVLFVKRIGRPEFEYIDQIEYPRNIASPEFQHPLSLVLQIVDDPSQTLIRLSVYTTKDASLREEDRLGSMTCSLHTCLSHALSGKLIEQKLKHEDGRKHSILLASGSTISVQFVEDHNSDER